MALEPFDASVYHAVCRKNAGQLPKLLSAALKRDGKDLQRLNVPLYQCGYNLLHIAATIPAPEVVNVLLRVKCDPNARTSRGSTAVMKAVEARSPRTVAYLVKAGARVDAQDVDGNTALMRGVVTGNPNAANTMLRHKADPSITNSGNERAVELALRYGNSRSAAKLGGKAMVMVPGYIPPKVQTLGRSYMVLITIILSFADLFSDILVALSLQRHGQHVYAVISWTVLLLPSVVMALIPFQSRLERLLSVLQLRLVYESLISLNHKRFTVRFGAYQMLMCALEDVPHLLFQSFVAVEELRGEGSGGSVGTYLGVSLLIATINCSECLRTMFLQQYFVSDRSDPNTDRETTTSRMFSLTCVMLRASMFVVLAVVTRHFFFIFPIIVLISRTHVATVLHMKLAPLDPVVALLYDGALGPCRRAFAISVLMSLIEIWLGLLLLLSTGVFAFPGANHWALFISAVCIMLLYFYYARKVYDKLPVGKNAQDDGFNPEAEPWTATVRRCLFIFGSVPQWVQAARKMCASWRQQDSQVANSRTVVAPSSSGAALPWYLKCCPRGLFDGADEESGNEEPVTDDIEAAALDLPAQSDDAEVKSNNTDFVDSDVPRHGQELEHKEQEKKQEEDPAEQTPPDHGANTLYGRLTSCCRQTPTAVPDLEAPLLSGVHDSSNEAEEDTSGDGCWAGWKRSPHLVCLGLTCCVGLWIGLQVTCYECMYTRPKYGHYAGGTEVAWSRNCDRGLFGFCKDVGPRTAWVYVLGAIIYLAYLYEALTCHTAKYLIGLREQEEAYDQYVRSVGSRPKMLWHIECYHYETYTYTTTNAQGVTVTHQQQRKVVTHRVYREFEVDLWYDRAKPFPDKPGMLRLEYTHGYLFFDEFTRKQWITERDDFKKKNNKDTFQSFRVEYNIKRVEDALTYSAVHLPYFLRFTYYSIAALFLLAFPFRVWISAISTKASIDMKKTIRRLPPSKKAKVAPKQTAPKKAKAALKKTVPKKVGQRKAVTTSKATNSKGRAGRKTNATSKAGGNTNATSKAGGNTKAQQRKTTLRV